MTVLKSCRTSEMLMTGLETKGWVFDTLVSKLELTSTDQEFTRGLGAIDTLVHIGPDNVAAVLNEVRDKLGEQVDADRMWERVYGKEMEGVDSELTDVVPSVGMSETQLREEVAADLGCSGRPKRFRHSPVFLDGMAIEHELAMLFSSMRMVEILLLLAAALALRLDGKLLA